MRLLSWSLGSGEKLSGRSLSRATPFCSGPRIAGQSSGLAADFGPSAAASFGTSLDVALSWCSPTAGWPEQPAPRTSAAPSAATTSIRGTSFRVGYSIVTSPGSPGVATPGLWVPSVMHHEPARLHLEAGQAARRDGAHLGAEQELVADGPVHALGEAGAAAVDRL